MYHHAAKGYKCPICLGVRGTENEDTLLKQADLVYKDELVSVFIDSFWIKTVEGHVIVVPNKHYENIYEMPLETGHKIFEVTQKMAIAMKKAYSCDGVTIRQNNEPAGDQHAFHYHQHIFPRYTGDKFNTGMTKKSILSKPKDRIKYVKKLKAEI
jgi:histidine triad (HIT) family protein